jgi:quercetin dioxygenase-like cupin family protein
MGTQPNEAESGVLQVGEWFTARRAGDPPYHELVRTDSLSVGVYVLAAGARDPQRPHSEDEVYFVLEGEATIRIGTERHPVRSGSVVFVEAGVEHRFESIESGLKVLVFFAPAEGTRSTK